MTRLSSYSTYLSVFAFAIPGVLTIIALFTNKITDGPIPYFLLTSFLLVEVYLIYISKRVYYNGPELLIYNLFSEKCLVIDKTKLVGIEKRRWYQTRGSRIYRINYVDDNNNSKHLDFEMSWTINDPEGLMDEINSVD